MISESAIFVVLVASHGVVTSGFRLVTRLLPLAIAAGVVGSHVEAMRPAIVQVLKVLGCGVFGPELGFLFIELFVSEGSAVAGEGCLVVG